MLNELRNEIYLNAIKHGFYAEKEINIPEKLMLIVSELGEAMEAYRIDNYCKKLNCSDKDFEELIKDTFEDEIADTIIRILDLCGYMQIDIDKHIKLKMKYNKSRPYKHGKKC